jgi:hypothetical protein
MFNASVEQIDCNLIRYLSPIYRYLIINKNVAGSLKNWIFFLSFSADSNIGAHKEGGLIIWVISIYFIGLLLEKLSFLLPRL